MSFGFGISDFVTVGNLAWSLAKACKNASKDFQEIRNDVLSLHTAVKECQDEYENYDSVLHRSEKRRTTELGEILKCSKEILQQLEQLLSRYASLGTSQKRTWDLIRFSSVGTNEIRSQLTLQATNLTFFLTSLGRRSMCRMEKKLDEIAAEIRLGKHEASLSSLSDEDDGPEKERAWCLLLSELSEEFSIEDIETHKSHIIRHIRSLIDQGDLEAPMPPPDLDTNKELKISEKGPHGSGCTHHSCPHQGIRGPSNPLTEGKRRGTNDASGSALGAQEDYSSSIRSVPPCDEDLPTVSSISYWEPLSIGIRIQPDHYRVSTLEDSDLREDTFCSAEYGARSIPTYVAFTPDRVLVGQEARDQAYVNPENTLFGFTLLLGCLYEDHIVCKLRKQVPFAIVRKDRAPVLFVPCRNRSFTPEELTAFILRKLARVAETHYGGFASTADIFMRSAIGAVKEQAWIRAASLAKLGVRQLHSTIESTAKRYARDHLERDSYQHTYLMAVDVRVDGCECALFKVPPSTSRSFLQLVHVESYFDMKRSFDACLVDRFCRGSIAEYSESEARFGPHTLTQVKKKVKIARHQLVLTRQPGAKITVNCFHRGVDLATSVRQDHLLHAAESFLISNIKWCHTLVRERQLMFPKAKDVNDVILLGEMTKPPQVRKAILAALGMKVTRPVQNIAQKKSILPSTIQLFSNPAEGKKRVC